jgi:hypothetical protein
MVEPRLEKTKHTLMRWLKWCLALFVLGVICLVTLIRGAFSVGYLNMTVAYWHLKPQATLAMDYPLEPGQSEVVRMEEDQLVAQRIGGMGMGGMRLGHTPDGDRYVTFDRGGGHLGIQGYVYAPYAEDSDEVHQDAFDGFEGREVSFLFGGWYTYDSTEE